MKTGLRVTLAVFVLMMVVPMMLLAVTQTGLVQKPILLCLAMGAAHAGTVFVGFLVGNAGHEFVIPRRPGPRRNAGAGVPMVETESAPGAGLRVVGGGNGSARASVGEAPSWRAGGPA